MTYLILVRHGLSTYNAEGLWAGWDDPDLTAEGIEEAKKAGESIKDIPLDVGFTSVLKRAKNTLEEIKYILMRGDLPTIENMALNERNYGDFTKKNKWDVQKQLGEDEFQKLRRSWDYPIQNGESLKQVYERVIPFYESQILPYLKQQKNVIISSSGNALRALVKYLEKIPDEQIATLEIGTGEVCVYAIDPKDGSVLTKEIRSSNPHKGKI